MDPSLLANADKLADLKSRKSSLENDLSEVEKAIRELSQSMLQVMVNSDIQTFKTSLGTFYIHRQERARIIDEARAFQFLRDAGVGNVIKQTVNHNTLSAVYKELSEANKTNAILCRDQGIEVFVDESVRLRK